MLRRQKRNIILSHYQKLATLILRLITFVILFIGVLGLLYYMLPSQTPPSEREGRMFSSVGFTVFGLIGFFVSPVLGRLIGKDL